MNNKLLILSKLLKKRGHNLCAAKVENLSKTAVPLEGIFRLPKEEEELKIDDIRIHKTEEWYGALQALGTNVILIPFNQDDLRPEDIRRLSNVFGFEVSDYENFFILASNINNRETGNLKILKENFPSLGAKIDSFLAEKEMDENDVVFFLYNEADSEINFEKSPRYIGHDFGHMDIEIGFNRIKQYKFKQILLDHLSDLCRLYIGEKEGEPTLYNAIVSQYGGQPNGMSIEDEQWEQIIGQIFSTYSALDDLVFDVFSYALAGTLKAEAPEVIHYYTREIDGRFILNDSAAARRILDSLINELDRYTRGENGPLSAAKGKVILYDV